MMNSSNTLSKWLTNMSMGVNLLNIRVPYVPLLLKEITAYVQLSDYESNRIKSIQTIGYIQREEDISKIVDINIKGVEFPISINNLPITDIYFDVPRNNCNSIWEYNVVRVYGTLVKKGTQITIEVMHVFEIKDVITCEQMFNTLSAIARKGYHQYYTRTEPHK